jgi:hypothetical protein
VPVSYRARLALHPEAPEVFEVFVVALHPEAPEVFEVFVVALHLEVLEVSMPVPSSGVVLVVYPSVLVFVKRAVMPLLYLL